VGGASSFMNNANCSTSRFRPWQNRYRLRMPQPVAAGSSLARIGERLVGDSCSTW